MNFKQKTPRDAKYLDWIRTLPCCLCQKPAPSIAHHSETGGMGIKGSDYTAVPLCPVCHDRVHRMIGKNCERFKRMVGILTVKYIAEGGKLNSGSPNDSWCI